MYGVLMVIRTMAPKNGGWVCQKDGGEGGVVMMLGFPRWTAMDQKVRVISGSPKNDEDLSIVRG